MSFADPGDPHRAPGSARNLKGRTPRTPRTPRGGVDDAFQVECCKVKEAAQKIQEHAREVQNQVTFLSHGSGKAKSKAVLQASVRDAKGTGESALSSLRSLASTPGLSVEEQNNRKFMLEKLSENLQVTLKSLDAAWSTYEAADAAHSRQQAIAANSSREATDDDKADMKKSLLSSGDPNIDPVLAPVSGDDTPDVEANRQALAQEQEEDMSTAELEIHAEIANEYARELRIVSEEVRTINSVMTDLAITARSQGEMINDIESNLESVADNTASANQEVAVTAERQAQRSKRFVWLLVIAGTLAGAGALLT